MATSNINKMIIYSKKKTKILVATALKIISLIEQFYRHCCCTAAFWRKVNFILSASCNNENKINWGHYYNLLIGFS